MPSGRLKESIDTLPEGWETIVLELYAEGASDVEIKATIANWRGSFSNDLWDRWLLEEPIFSETIKKGKMLSHAWWEKTGRKNLHMKDFQSALWYMNMKNRFGWADNQRNEHTGANGGPIQITGMEIK